MTVSSLVKALLVASDRNLFRTNVSKKKSFYLFIYLFKDYSISRKAEMTARFQGGLEPGLGNPSRTQAANFCLTYCVSWL